MTAPLTDEQVAEPLWVYDEDGYCVCCGNGKWKHHMPECELADLLAYRALRPDCPTCGGERVIYDLRCDHCGGSASLPLGMTCLDHQPKPQPCRDCTDGKMPLDKWVALLVETLAAARSDMEGWAAYASDYFTAKHNLAGDLASVDAVLKMVPKVAERRSEVTAEQVAP